MNLYDKNNSENVYIGKEGDKNIERERERERERETAKFPRETMKLWKR